MMNIWRWKSSCQIPDVICIVFKNQQSLYLFFQAEREAAQTGEQTIFTLNSSAIWKCCTTVQLLVGIGLLFSIYFLLWSCFICKMIYSALWHSGRVLIDSYLTFFPLTVIAVNQANSNARKIPTCQGLSNETLFQYLFQGHAKASATTQCFTCPS